MNRTETTGRSHAPARELVTHDGTFHADDVFALAVLRRVFPHANFVRSREPEWIEAAKGRIVFDVGGAYDPELGLFDHHQPGGAATRNKDAFERPGEPSQLAAFGLVWKHFGSAWLATYEVPAKWLGAAQYFMDEGFVRAVDEHDTGQATRRSSSVSLLVADFIADAELEPGRLDPKLMFEQMVLAAEWAAGILERRLKSVLLRIRDAEEATEVARGWQAQGRNWYVELPRPMGWHSLLSQGLEIESVVYFDGSQWVGTQVSIEPGSTEQKRPLPEDWRGHSGRELGRRIGLPGIEDRFIFCHAAGFLLIAKDREALMSALTLAREMPR